MTARGFEYYGQSVATMVAPTASAPAAPAVAPARSTAPARLMRFSAYLLTFAGALWLAALIATVTPLGAIDADITVPFVAVVVGALVAIVWDVMRR